MNDNNEENNYEIGESKKIIICNIACMLICSGFFIIELIQISILGFSNYWNESRAFELFWFPIQLIYFYFKLQYPNESYPLVDYTGSADLAGHKQNMRVMMLFALLNAVLLVLIGLKIFYFLTIDAKFGTMIKLIQQTLDQI